MADIFERLAAGEPVHMYKDPDYIPVAHAEMDRCRSLCFKINTTDPAEGEKIRGLESELFSAGMGNGSFFTPPFQVDYANQVRLEGRVFANHDLTMMAAGSVTIEDGVMMGPHVTLLTTNHDLADLAVLKCKPIVLKHGCWIGANSTILPGITVGEGAVVGSGSVVTHDVPAGTVVAGNPARLIKRVSS